MDVKETERRHKDDRRRRAGWWGFWGGGAGGVWPHARVSQHDVRSYLASEVSVTETLSVLLLQLHRTKAS